ncbi:MAG: YggT family protein [Gammaproteobacteria bacterium]|jgi:YggT family protein|nr:YggT family protein [Gammaproteobacteria bacterium]
MGPGYFTSPVEFLVSTLFSLYVLALMLRFLLAWVRADFYNPVSQFLVRITNPVLVPVRRVIPPVGGIDMASIVVMLLVQMIGIALILLLRGGGIPLQTLIFASLAELIDLAFKVFIYGIVIQAILSWINPGTYNPAVSLLHALTEPVLRPVRRILPPISGLDLSPLLAILVLEVLRRLVVPLIFALA